MKSLSSIFAKGEELMKQVADKATVLADKMKEEDWVQKMSQSVNDTVEAIKNEYKTVTDPTQSLIREAIPGFVSIDCPSEKTVDSISATLRSRYNEDSIMIINMSERTYDYDKMPGHVITVNFRGLPSPPLDVLCRLCLQIHQWKSRNQNNMVIVHCFPGYSRSAVLIACYQAWCGACSHPVDALIDVCRGLKIDENDSILPSQKRYLNYFFDLLTNGDGIPKLPATSLRVRKLILTGVPNIPVSEDAKFRPFYEIWTSGKLVYSSLPRDVPMETLVESVVTAYDIISPPGEIVASFDDSNNISEEQPLCRGDVLIRVRHLSASGPRFTCLRFAFNTNYVYDNVLHLSQHEIDGHNFPKCFVEIVFEPCVNPPSLGSDDERLLFERSHQVSSRLRQGFSIDEETERDVEEVLRAKVLGLDQGIPSHPSNQAHVGIDSQVPVIPIHDNTPVGNSGDDVDDFFAQLEREAKM